MYIGNIIEWFDFIYIHSQMLWWLYWFFIIGYLTFKFIILHELIYNSCLISLDVATIILNIRVSNGNREWLAFCRYTTAIVAQHVLHICFLYFQGLGTRLQIRSRLIHETTLPLLLRVGLYDLFTLLVTLHFG